jgi:hypothetical protein
MDSQIYPAIDINMLRSVHVCPYLDTYAQISGQMRPDMDRYTLRLINWLQYVDVCPYLDAYAQIELYPDVEANHPIRNQIEAKTICKTKPKPMANQNQSPTEREARCRRERGRGGVPFGDLWAQSGVSFKFVNVRKNCLF